jgi:hypothetical protein
VTVERAEATRAVAFWRKRDAAFGAVAGRFASPVEQAEPAQCQMLAATLRPS